MVIKNIIISWLQIHPQYVQKLDDLLKAWLDYRARRQGFSDWEHLRKQMLLERIPVRLRLTPLF